MLFITKVSPRGGVTIVHKHQDEHIPAYYRMMMRYKAFTECFINDSTVKAEWGRVVTRSY